jgi:hypothetical protein
MHRETPIAVAVLVCALAGCAPRPLDSRDLASSLRATSSLAAEAGIFIDYLNSGRPAAAFARAHAEYLLKELDDESHDLDGARVVPPLRPTLETCRAQQQQLGRELRRLDAALAHPDELAEIAKQIRAIGESAAQARASL